MSAAAAVVESAPVAPPRAGRARGWVPLCAIIFILLVGSGYRAWLVADVRLGHKPDLELFIRWCRGLHQHGLAKFYAEEAFCDYPPLSVLLMYGAGGVAAAMDGAAPGDDVMQRIFKAIPCLADLLIAVLLALEARRRIGRAAGVAALGLFYLNPVVIYDSAYWGQLDSFYTLFLVTAVILLNRRNWLGAGAAFAAGLLAKFQSIVLAPLLLFETYRVGGFKALGMQLAAMIVLAALVLAPFALTNSAKEVLSRSYVHVVGQYTDLAKGAFNLWHLVGGPRTSDTGLPPAIIRIVANGETSFAESASPLTRLTWRNISLVIFALAVALILTLYSLRPGPLGRLLTAGMLYLAFFLFPTEMHERYAFPALAFLAVWGVSAAARERVYFALTLLMLLNLTAILPPEPLAQPVAAGYLLVFGVMLLAGNSRLLAAGDSAAVAIVPAPEDLARPPVLVRIFRYATLLALVVGLGVAIWLTVLYQRAPVTAPPANIVYLSDLRPRIAQQGWKTLKNDASVTGGNLRLGGRIYTRGLGTHAPARLQYEIPRGATRFHAVAGVDAATAGTGSVNLFVELDGKPILTTPVLTGQTAPLVIDLPVSGGRLLTLRAESAGDGPRADHVSWANARFLLAESAPASQPPATQPDEGVPLTPEELRRLDALRGR